MSNSIPLSPKHGLNPTIPICFWCGKEKNEIALLGKIKTDKRGEDPEAPHSCVLDYEPCDCCKEQWGKGVTLIEVSVDPNVAGQPPMQTNAYPTGRFAVVNPEALVGDFKVGDKAFMRPEDFSATFAK